MSFFECALYLTLTLAKVPVASASSSPRWLCHDGTQAWVIGGARVPYATSLFTIYPVSSGLPRPDIGQVWPYERGMAALEMSFSKFLIVDVRTLKAMYSGSEEPIGFSWNGRVVLTRKDSRRYSILRDGLSKPLKFKLDVFACSVSPDGDRGIFFTASGQALLVRNMNGPPSINTLRVSGASPMFPTDWSGPTVAFLANDVKNRDARAFWLCDTNTGTLKCLGSQVLAVTTNKEGFVCLTREGDLRYLLANGTLGRAFARLASSDLEHFRGVGRLPLYAYSFLLMGRELLYIDENNKLHRVVIGRK